MTSRSIGDIIAFTINTTNKITNANSILLLKEPTQKLLQCMMRGLGTNFDDGINILNTYHNPTLFCTLLESSAILDNSNKSAEFIESTITSDSCYLNNQFKDMIRSMIMMMEPQFITACLMIAVSQFSMEKAYDLINRSISLLVL